MGETTLSPNKTKYNLLLMLVSGLGGLLYGVDIGVIDPALPYLNQSVKLSEQNTSYIVAAVLAGSLFGSIIAGFLADWLGRKIMMIVSALLFVGSVLLIYSSSEFIPLMVGRLLQGMSGGVIAVVVPLYLAECLPSKKRGSGTAIFQFALTFGILAAAFVGGYYISRAEHAIDAAGSNQAAIVSAADHAWRSMFLTVVYPGVLFLLGTLLLSESPRWLYRRGKKEAARTALLRMRSDSDAELELKEMADSLAAEHSKPKVSFVESTMEIFTQRKYVLPFILACIVLGCNQATGINSVLQFMSTILQKAGLDAVSASSYGTAIKAVNCVMTIVAIVLVERKGRTFLLKIGTGGIIVSLCVLAGVFYSVESKRVNVEPEVVAMVKDNKLELDVTKAKFASQTSGDPVQISILYSYGNKQAVAAAFMPTPESQKVLDDAKTIIGKLSDADRELLAKAKVLKAKDIEKLSAEEKVVVDAAVTVRKNLGEEARATLANADKIETSEKISIAPDTKDMVNADKPLKIERAKVGPIPSANNGLISALCIAIFIAFFSIGPGVCVWLALSELMPTRIRSAGMGIALLINQGVATGIAAFFLPIVGNYGYYAMFLFWAGCTVIYFVTSAFFLPETKGKTLEEIETYFEGKKA